MELIILVNFKLKLINHVTSAV